ncbi:MAG: hypothetical protein AAB377_01295 [Patescibacteria group bacterium]
MNSFKNNRVVLATFAILMAIGLMAAYIPMIFPPPAEVFPAANLTEDDYNAQLPAENNIATTTPTSTPAKTSLPDSFSGLQDEQNSLNDLNDLLNK